MNLELFTFSPGSGTIISKMYFFLDMYYAMVENRRSSLEKWMWRTCFPSSSLVHMKEAYVSGGRFDFPSSAELCPSFLLFSHSSEHTKAFLIRTQRTICLIGKLTRYILCRQEEEKNVFIWFFSRAPFHWEIPKEECKVHYYHCNLQFTELTFLSFPFRPHIWRNKSFCWQQRQLITIHLTSLSAPMWKNNTTFPSSNILRAFEKGKSEDWEKRKVVGC